MMPAVANLSIKNETTHEGADFRRTHTSMAAGSFKRGPVYQRATSGFLAFLVLDPNAWLSDRRNEVFVIDGRPDAVLFAGATERLAGAVLFRHLFGLYRF